MATWEKSARAHDRERALQTVRSWTWVAGLGGIGLTAVIAVLAASSFAGRQATPAATPAATANPASPDNTFTPPQPLPQDSFGGSNQPPAAVSGGS